MSSSLPDVSVIIPLYNGAEWIEETISSVLAQRHRPREIVVVDDGSSDRSPELARSYPGVTLVRSSGNSAAEARDFGLRHTSAPLVAFLDQDDLWHPAHLHLLVHLLSRYPTALAAAADNHQFEDGSTPRYDLRSDGVGLFDPWDRFPLNSTGSPSCVVIRRRALERVGGWPHDFKVSDVHAWFKLAVEGPMVRSGRTTVGKRVHTGSSMHMLRQNPLFFLQESINVYRHVLDFREDLRRETSEMYRDQLDTYRAVGDVLEGVITRDTELLQESAHFLEHDSRTDHELTRAFWLSILWMLRSRISPPDQARRCAVLHRLVRTWPADCPHARNIMYRALARTMSGWSFASCLAQNPRNAGVWGLFMAVLKVKLREKWPRL